MNGAASFEESFEQRAWVRALARRLCADANDAEDLEQATWLEVARGGGAPRSPRQWLGGIVRHLARRERGSRLARRERERRAARAEAVPSADTMLAQAELQRRVLAAVARLDEAQRVVVLMRYHEGLDGAEIARRLGVPGSTVRSRLARAQARLRAELDGEYGGERAAWAVLFAPALATKSAAGAAAIGVGVAMKVQVAFAAAAVVALTVFLWPDRADLRTESLPAAERELVTALAPALGQEEAGGIERSAGIERAAVEPAAVPAAPLLVHGALLGLDGLETLEGELVFVDERCESRSATLGAGAYTLFGLTPGPHRIHATLRGCVPFTDELVVPPAQAKVRHDVHLRRALALPVRFVDRATGAALEDPTFGEPLCGLGAAATLDPPGRIEGVFGRAVDWTEAGRWRPSKRLGEGERVAWVLELWAEPPLFVSALMRDVVIESRLVQGTETELVFELDRAALEALFASVTLRCVDLASGAPVEPTRVELAVADGGCSGNETRADGAVTLSRLQPGWRRLEVHAAGYASHVRWLRLEPGAHVDLGEVGLTLVARTRGRVIGPDGAGLAVLLDAFTPRGDATPRDLTQNRWHRSGADGAFEIDGFPQDRVRIVARDEEHAWTAFDVDLRGGSREGLELRLERGTEVWLRPPRGRTAPIGALLADDGGRVLGSLAILGSAGQRLRLESGKYELRLVEDNAVVRVQSFSVGAERTVIEVEAP